MIERRIIELLAFDEDTTKFLISASLSGNDEIRQLVEKMGKFDLEKVDSFSGNYRKLLYLNRFNNNKTIEEVFGIESIGDSQGRIHIRNYTKKHEKTGESAAYNERELIVDTRTGKGEYRVYDNTQHYHTTLFDYDKQHGVIKNVRDQEYDEVLERIQATRFSETTQILLRALLDAGNQLVAQLQFYSTEEVEQKSTGSELALCRQINDLETETLIINDKRGLVVELQNEDNGNKYRETLIMKEGLKYQVQKQDGDEPVQIEEGSLAEYVSMEETATIDGADGGGKE